MLYFGEGDALILGATAMALLFISTWSSFPKDAPIPLLFLSRSKGAV